MVILLNHTQKQVCFREKPKIGSSGVGTGNPPTCSFLESSLSEHSRKGILEILSETAEQSLFQKKKKKKSSLLDKENFYAFHFLPFPSIFVYSKIKSFVSYLGSDQEQTQL